MNTLNSWGSLGEIPPPTPSEAVQQYIADEVRLVRARLHASAVRRTRPATMASGSREETSSLDVPVAHVALAEHTAASSDVEPRRGLLRGTALMLYWIDLAGDASFPNPHPPVLRDANYDPTREFHLSQLIRSLRGQKKGWSQWLNYDRCYIQIIPNAVNTRITVGPAQDDYRKSTLVVDHEGSVRWVQLLALAREVVDVPDFPLVVAFLQRDVYRVSVHDVALVFASAPHKLVVTATGLRYRVYAADVCTLAEECCSSQRQVSAKASWGRCATAK
eukprot:4208684-Amphidinium_carterae.1